MYRSALQILDRSLDSVAVTEEDRRKFLDAVLQNKPFKKTVKLGNLEITFRSLLWDVENYENLDQLDAILTLCLEEVKLNGNDVYRYDPALSLEDNFATLRGVFGQAAGFPIIVQHFRYFLQTFRKLVEEAKHPDFFAESPGEGQK